MSGGGCGDRAGPGGRDAELGAWQTLGPWTQPPPAAARPGPRAAFCWSRVPGPAGWRVPSDSGIRPRPLLTLCPRPPPALPGVQLHACGTASQTSRGPGSVHVAVAPPVPSRTAPPAAPAGSGVFCGVQSAPAAALSLQTRHVPPQQVPPRGRESGRRGGRRPREKGLFGVGHRGGGPERGGGGAGRCVRGWGTSTSEPRACGPSGLGRAAGDCGGGRVRRQGCGTLRDAAGAAEGGHGTGTATLSARGGRHLTASDALGSKTQN